MGALELAESKTLRRSNDIVLLSLEDSLSAGTRIGLDAAAPSTTTAIRARQNWGLRLERAIERGADHLLSLQVEQGYWLGELEADSTLESDYIYYLHVLGKADPERIAKHANSVRRKQL